MKVNVVIFWVLSLFFGRLLQAAIELHPTEAKLKTRLDELK